MLGSPGAAPQKLHYLLLNSGSRKILLQVRIKGDIPECGGSSIQLLSGAPLFWKYWTIIFNTSPACAPAASPKPVETACQSSLTDQYGSAGYYWQP